MRRSTQVSLFLFLCAASVPMVGASEPEGGPVAPLPLVFRGEAVSGVASGEAVAGLAVPVLRGSGAAAARPAAMDRVAYGDPAVPWRLVGGEKLWFVDPEAGRVIACRERNTSTVGRRTIDCTGRTPRALAR